MSVRIVATARGPVEVSIRGEGAPVLFVHGGHSNCHETIFLKGFDPACFRLIVPSRPGYGRTPRPATPTPATTAALLIDLLDALGVERVSVVGVSAGGPTALYLAAHYPTRVARLLLISAVTEQWLSPEDATYRKGKKAFAPGIERVSWAAFRALYAFLPRTMARMLGRELSTHPPLTYPEAELAELGTMIRRQRSGSGFIHDMDQVVDPAVYALITCPTLLLHSRHDRTVSLTHAEHAQARITGAQLKTYANPWGHLLWLGPESTQPIRDALAFLQPTPPTVPLAAALREVIGA